MRIFAIDTTVKTAAAALVEDGKLIAEYSLITDTHSTTLLPMISSIFEMTGYKVSDIDLFAVSAGPGSFTGVRIGVSTIKGLAFADQIPCAGVSSLEALVMNFTGIRGTIVPVINARNKMVYTALFASDGIHVPERISEDEQIAISDLLEKLKDAEGPVYFTGDAYAMLHSEEGKPQFTAETPEKLRSPSGYGAAIAAEKMWNAAEDKNVFHESHLAPIYLRKSQAEREREEKINNNKE